MTTQTITQKLSTTILNAGATTAIYGAGGAGKSTALAGIAKEALAAGREVVSINVADLGGRIWGLDGARMITRAPEAIRFLHGVLDRFRASEAGAVGPVILMEDFGATAEDYPEVAMLIRELIWKRDSAITTVFANNRPDANVSIKGQSVVYLASPDGHAYTVAVDEAFGAKDGAAAHTLLTEASETGIRGTAVASVFGRAPEKLSF